MDMSKEEVTAIMSLAKKILQHQSDKEWLQDLQDESVDTPNDEEKRERNKDYELDNMTNDANHDKVLRRSEDQGDSYG
jgi:hypothetical protein